MTSPYWLADTLYFLGNHIWQSTMFAAAAALVALAFRRHGARVRYGLWLAASLKFAIPFSLLATLGSQLSWRTVEVIPYETPALMLQVIGEPFSQDAVTLRSGARRTDGESIAQALPIAAGIAWALGCAALLA